MRFAILFFGLLLAATFAPAQAPASPPPAASGGEAAAQLEGALPFYDFHSPSVKPWHLKATYQLYDLKGKPEEQGTWEHWWASPKVYRESWTRSGVSRSEWSTADGKTFRNESGGTLRYFERNLESILLSPLPSAAMLDPDKTKLGLKTVQAGRAQLACVSVEEQRTVDGRPVAPVPAVANDYCFDPPTHALRMKYSSSNNLVTEYNQIARTQGRYLAGHVDVVVGKEKVFSLAVDSIDAMDAADAALTPPADAAIVTEKEADPTAKLGVAVGSLVKKSPPVYPALAKMRRIQGTVILAAVIGKDGTIRDLEVLASPSPLLADAAMDSVKSWQYKPYLLNGAPVEVETIVNVVFSLGG